MFLPYVDVYARPRLGGQGADEPDEAYEKEIFHEGIQAVGESGFNAEAITHRVP
jgi:hypothetical protein